MRIKLYLVVGDAVRNINRNSSRRGWVGVVKKIDQVNGGCYGVEYQNGEYQLYNKSKAHNYLEKLVSECPCTQQVLKLDFSKLEERVLAGYAAGDFMAIGAIHDEISYAPKRRTLKKVRRNVISGKTQDEMVKMYGHSRGVQQFNTRALGLSTGQAMARIADALMHPGKNVRVWDVDHAITGPNVQAGRGQLNKTFVALVESLIEKNKLVGFTFDLPKQYMTFTPIVTEETYVETH
ncbi:MAG: hypothetical protein ACRC29_02335 [Enterobacterales bacterium]